MVLALTYRERSCSWVEAKELIDEGGWDCTWGTCASVTCGTGDPGVIFFQARCSHLASCSAARKG